MSDLTIGAVMEVLGGEYYGGILGGIERVARERDARLLVFRGTSVTGGQVLANWIIHKGFETDGEQRCKPVAARATRPRIT